MMSEKKKVLIVDDDADIAVLLERALKAKGYEVMTAQDGWEALKQIQTYLPDLILADLMMPNFDGWRLSQKLRDKELFRKIPIILLSALVEKEGPADDLEVGDYYMTKPFDREKLLDKIKELLKE